MEKAGGGGGGGSGMRVGVGGRSGMGRGGGRCRAETYAGAGAELEAQAEGQGEWRRKVESKVEAKISVISLLRRMKGRELPYLQQDRKKRLRNAISAKPD